MEAPRCFTHSGQRLYISVPDVQRPIERAVALGGRAIGGDAQDTDRRSRLMATERQRGLPARAHTLWITSHSRTTQTLLTVCRGKRIRLW
jgi:hypothetical protein